MLDHLASKGGRALPAARWMNFQSARLMRPSSINARTSMEQAKRASRWLSPGHWPHGSLQRDRFWWKISQILREKGMCRLVFILSYTVYHTHLKMIWPCLLNGDLENWQMIYTEDTQTPTSEIRNPFFGIVSDKTNPGSSSSSSQGSRNLNIHMVIHLYHFIS